VIIIENNTNNQIPLHISSKGKVMEHNGIKYKYTFPENEITLEEWRELGNKIYQILFPTENN
jgi:hypothetical protein